MVSQIYQFIPYSLICSKTVTLLVANKLTIINLELIIIMYYISSTNC
jgi:hypothetical protein